MSPNSIKSHGTLSPSELGMEKRRESIIDPNNKELTPKQQVARMLASKKKEQAEAATFKPKLVSGSSKSFGESTDLASSRFDRLYGDAKSRQAKAQVEEVRRSRELDFKPKITARGASRERGSDSARYSEPGAGRVSAKVAEAKEKSTPTFVPEITRRASSIDRSHSQQKTGDRLYSAAQTLKERTEMRKAELEKKASVEHTFQPKLNARRSSSADGRSPVVTLAEVSARQKKYEADRAKRREELLKAKEERETKELLLKPKINVNPALLPASVASTTVFERLQNPTTKDLSELAQQLDSELTFRPKLAPYVPTSSLSSAGVADGALEGSSKGDIHSRLYQEGIQKLQQRQLEAEKVQQEALEKLTFHPTLPQSPAASASALTAANLAANAEIARGADTAAGAGFGEGSQTGTTRTSSSVFDRLTSTNKAQAADMLLQIKTQLDLQECTFKPTVHAPPSSSGSVDGAGGSIFERLQRDAEMQRKKLENLEAERVEKEKMQLQPGPNIPQSSREILIQKKIHSPKANPQSPPSSPSGRRTSLLAKEKEQGRASSPHKSFPAPHPQYSFKVSSWRRPYHYTMSHPTSALAGLLTTCSPFTHWLSHAAHYPTKLIRTRRQTQ